MRFKPSEILNPFPAPKLLRVPAGPPRILSEFFLPADNRLTEISRVQIPPGPPIYNFRWPTPDLPHMFVKMFLGAVSAPS